MSKLQEILDSGHAPGVVTGRPVDPQSVYVKAPKGLREVENEPIFKHGPARGARRIANYFGFSVDNIKKTWAKPPLALLLVMVSLLGRLSHAGDLTSGEQFIDGQTVHASDLNNAIGGATLNGGTVNFISRQTIDNSPLSSDYIILYSPTLSGTFKTLLSSIFQNSQGYTLLPAGNPVYTNADLFSFYSAANTNVESVIWSNLVALVISNANPSYLRFAVTNAGSGTNINYLPLWPGVFSGLNTNVQPYSLWWQPNGVPYYQPLSNVEKSVAADMGTNWSLQYVFNQIFQPWTVYGTNQNFTNGWGYQTNFEITALNMFSQTVNALTNLPTLTDTDSVPVLSGPQGNTNTMASLLSIYQYLTNKNALPPFTIARVQFSGQHVSMTVTNMSLTTGIITNIANAAAWTVPTPVSWQGAASQIPTTRVALSNAVYYALLTNTTPIGFQLYTNIANANARTNYVLGNGVNPSATGTLLWLTNFTSFACDAIQLSAGTGVRTANYGIFFRSPAANNLYYITATPVNNDSLENIVQIQQQNAYDQPSTNGCVLAAKGTGNSYQELIAIHALINPQ